LFLRPLIYMGRQACAACAACAALHRWYAGQRRYL